MANQLYLLAKQSFLLGQFNLATDDVRVVLTDTGLYAPNFATDQFLTSIPVGARGATSPALGAKTTTGGVFDAGDFSFGNVPGPVSYEALVLYTNTGVDATSRLVCYLDTLTGLPVVSNNGPISVVFGAYIFQLAGTCP